MTKYSCKCGETKDLAKATIVLRDKKWVAKEAENRDKLWDGAKEKLIGERGINEDF